MDSKHAESKSKYCELCHEYYSYLKSHLSTPAHVRASADCAGELKNIVKEFQDDFFEVSVDVKLSSGDRYVHMNYLVPRDPSLRCSQPFRT